MNEIYIHKVHVSPEAKYDYEECMELGVIPKMEIKNAVEEFLYIRQSEGELKHYYRLKYFDERSNEMLMLFIRKGKNLLSMQIWEIKGICLAEDFDEDFEDLGKNKSWYESSIDITGFPKIDWVKEIGKNIEEIKTCNIIGLYKEVENAIKNGGYKRNS